jgi:uncharacterized protein YbjT (DUF2867 family)
MILLTGATGYVGGRLLKALEADGRQVRCLARRPRHLSERIGPMTQVVLGDVLDPATLAAAFHGVEDAYYLVHSMGDEEFEEQDRRAARGFARAAKEAGVRRIVYLGGLGVPGGLSPHLESRQEVGCILRESAVPTIELRASIIIGSGSLSFEMIRALVERLPVMITPRWTRSLSQPIAIEDVVGYLKAALDAEVDGSAIFEIGGADRVSYAGIMREFARLRGLRRSIVSVPVLTPHLSSLWLALVTPLYARIGRKLIDSVRNDTVVTDPAALETFPIRPRGIREAIGRAVANEDRDFAATRWSDALSSGGPLRGYGGVRFGARLVDSRTEDVACEPARAFVPIRHIGGATGWYYGNWLWRIRGFLDLLVGGVGLRRGRRDAEHLAPGDTVDFWRVEEIVPDRLLRLRAEMKVPGRAWLQFEVEANGEGSTIRQTAMFDPVGLAGLLYWYSVYPFHGLVFRGMLDGIARAAEDG